VVVASVEPLSVVRVAAAIGQRLPLHVTAAGKILLAFQPQNVMKLLEQIQLQAYTKNTVTDPAELVRQVEAIKMSKLVWVTDEYVEGLVTAAVPIFGWDRSLQGCLVVASNRLGQDEKELIERELGKARCQLEERLGARLAAGDSCNHYSPRRLEGGTQ